MCFNLELDSRAECNSIINYTDNNATSAILFPPTDEKWALIVFKQRQLQFFTVQA